MTVQQTIARLNVPPTPEGLDRLVAWAVRGVQQTAEPWSTTAADVLAMAALAHDQLEALVLQRPPERGSRVRYRARRSMWQPDPDRTTWQHHDEMGWVRPPVYGPVRTFDEWDAECARLDEVRRERAVKLARNLENAGNGKQWTDDERRNLAHALGARINGDRARDVLCPSCGRRSVWWYVSMTGHTFGGAACKHRNSCGWAGHLRAMDVA